jgi:hypothetical protein
VRARHRVPENGTRRGACGLRSVVMTFPGLPVLPGRGAGPAYVTTLSYVRSDWSITPRIALTAAFVHGDSGALIRSAGGHALNYGDLTIDLHI